MDVVIGAIVSAIGAYFSGADFFVLHSCTSLSLALYKSWTNHTHDKTALQ